MPSKLPVMRRHKGRRRDLDRAYVRLNGDRHYLGPWGAPETQRAFDRLLAEWLDRGRRLPDAAPQGAVGAALTVAQLADRFEAHAKVYYRNRNGSPTGEHQNVAAALKPLRHLYGDLPAADMTAPELKIVRSHLVASKLSRGVVNQRVGVIRRAFAWAEGEGLVPEGKTAHLRALANLKAGRSDARETDPVVPVAWKDVKRTLPHLSDVVRAMVLVQWHTGMRPSEVTRMTRRAIDQTGDVWIYRPEEHKNQHRGKDRIVALGPKAQEILKPFIEQPRLGYLFPPEGGGNLFYLARAYRRAIARACKRAGVQPWFPLQLRHSAATRLRKSDGLEAAQVALGHAKVETTQVYAERDLKRAVDLARRLG